MVVHLVQQTLWEIHLDYYWVELTRLVEMKEQKTDVSMAFDLEMSLAHRKAKLMVASSAKTTLLVLHLDYYSGPLKPLVVLTASQMVILTVSGWELLMVSATALSTGDYWASKTQSGPGSE